MISEEVELPLDRIEIDPANIRTRYDPAVVTGLRHALEGSGEYINPPVVYPIGENRYRVKHGSTRVLAARGVRQTLRVRVCEPPPTESSKLLSQMSENLLQGSLGPADVGGALKRLRTAEGQERSISQVVGALKAAGINRTKSWVLMHLALAELAPEVQTLINRGQLAAEVGYQLRGLPPSEQIAWAERVMNEGLTREELRQKLGVAGDVEPAPSEYTQRELGERLRAAAGVLDQERRRRRQLPSPDRRNSAVTVRRELLPVAIEPQDDAGLRPLSATDWAKKATGVERQLAQEALFFGGYSAQQAIELVERAMSEVPQASDAIVLALNAVGRLMEQPAELTATKALGDILAFRMERVLQSLGRR